LKVLAVVAGAGVGYWAFRAARAGRFNEGTIGHATLTAIQVGGLAAAVLTVVLTAAR
jgi:hypothetical protein